MRNCATRWSVVSTLPGVSRISTETSPSNCLPFRHKVMHVIHSARLRYSLAAGTKIREWRSGGCRTIGGQSLGRRWRRHTTARLLVCEKPTATAINCPSRQSILCRSSLGKRAITTTAARTRERPRLWTNHCERGHAVCPTAARLGSTSDQQRRENIRLNRRGILMMLVAVPPPRSFDGPISGKCDPSCIITCMKAESHGCLHACILCFHSTCP
jgi:hypothetical protein